MFCAECGAENIDGAKFCITCGASLDKWTPQEKKVRPVDIPANFDMSISGEHTSGDVSTPIERSLSGRGTGGDIITPVDESLSDRVTFEGTDDARVLLREGDVVADRYEIRALLGRGGMGAVYRVWDQTLQEEIALKVLLPSLLGRQKAVERFYNEAKISLRLSHKNIVRVRDFGEDRSRGLKFITMELIQGKSLRSMIKEKKEKKEPFPAPAALRIVGEILEGLEYAHRFTIHRDLKPENIMITGEGEVKIMDFGIAKLLSPSAFTSTSMAMGTAYYMAPEQQLDAASVDARADIFSVCVMLYELLTGDLPVGRFKTPTEKRRALPKAVDPLILKSLQERPEDRYASVKELLQEIRKIAEVLPREERGGGIAVAEKRGRRSRLWVIAPLLLLVAVAVAAVVYFKYPRDKKDRGKEEAAALFARAQEEAGKENYREAIDLFTRLRADHPASALSERARTEILRCKKAEKEKAAASLFAEARDLAEKKEFKKAVERFKQLRIAYPDTEYFRKAEAQILKCVKERFEDGLALAAKKDYKGALGIMNEVRLLYFDTPYFTMAETEIARFRSDQQDYLRRAGKAFEAARRSFEAARKSADSGQFDEALRALREIEKNYPHTPYPEKAGSLSTKVTAARRYFGLLDQVQACLDRLDLTGAETTLRQAASLGLEDRREASLRKRLSEEVAYKGHMERGSQALAARAYPEAATLFEAALKLRKRAEAKEGRTRALLGMSAAEAKKAEAGGRAERALELWETLRQALEEVGRDTRPAQAEIERLARMIASNLKEEAEKRELAGDLDGALSLLKKAAAVSLKADPEGKTNRNIRAEQERLRKLKARLAEVAKREAQKDWAGALENLRRAKELSRNPEELRKTEQRLQAKKQKWEEEWRKKLTAPPGLWWKPTAEQTAYAIKAEQPVYMKNSLGMRLVLIPPGEFIMGSPSFEVGRGNYESQHPVKLTRGLHMSSTEVTQAQYRTLLGKDPSHFRGRLRPVEKVTWRRAHRFCQKLTEKERESGRIGPKDSYRLPTEAEWEYACRAGTTTPFHFGQTISTDQANYDGNYPYESGSKGLYREQTTVVGSFPANRWGLYDMHGNVREWCLDRYGDYPRGPIENPRGPGKGAHRILRGGSWFDKPDECRAAMRFKASPNILAHNVGFRIVLVRASPGSP
jgi:formylglycine-generating enzyme required for sulfatase activity